MRSFIDTNILVYADAGDEPVKQARALALILRLRADRSGVLSTQVLQEFVNVALRKLRLSAELVRERLAFYSGFDMVPTTPELVTAALDLHVTHQFPFYDALIVRAAAASGCGRLWSENLQSGRRLHGLVIANPFTDDDESDIGNG